MDTIILKDVVKEFPGERVKGRSILHPFEKIFPIRITRNQIIVR